MIVGVGLDLFDVGRMQRAAARGDLGVLDELFTDSEKTAGTAYRLPARWFAAAFAAKEACFKALGTGKVGAMSWRDVEVALTPEGAASFSLGGETARIASGCGTVRIHGSVAVTGREALAWVVIEAAADPPAGCREG